MAAAGLTHGGFYRHFDSKEQLVGEACAAALASTSESLSSAAQGKPHRKGLRAIVSKYLSTAHRDRPQAGLRIRGDRQRDGAGRQKRVAVATASFSKLVDVLAAGFDDIGPAEAKRCAMAAASTMIGALMMSRIVNDPELSKSILGQRRPTRSKVVSPRRGCAVLRLADEQARMRPRTNLSTADRKRRSSRPRRVLFRLLDRM